MLRELSGWRPRTHPDARRVPHPKLLRNRISYAQDTSRSHPMYHFIWPLSISFNNLCNKLSCSSKLTKFEKRVVRIWFSKVQVTTRLASKRAWEGRVSCGTETLTCEIWCYLQVDSIKNCRIFSWCQRTYYTYCVASPNIWCQKWKLINYWE